MDAFFRAGETRGTVAVFGAGIAGLTVAHELVRRGCRVAVYESSAEAGGFFRSARSVKHRGCPTEYSWHGMGPWYDNTFDLLKQIPFDASGSLYEKALSRPIDFGISTDRGSTRFYDGTFWSIPRMFGFSNREWVRWGWLMLKVWAANLRTEQSYSRRNAAESWRQVLSAHACRTWRSCFGPWIGSDWTRVSLHHAGQFFRKQLVRCRQHAHAKDDEGPAWVHGAGDGWLLLRGPSSEFWFERWVRDLSARGVSFVWNCALHRLGFEHGHIANAEMVSGPRVIADCYVLAINPFAAAQVLARTPRLEELEELRSFKPLIQDGPHVQISFRLGFSERIQFPRERTAVVLADSEFNLTLFAQEQVWNEEVDLGRRIHSLWTGTSCVSSVPGRLFNLPVTQCTREQFCAEVKEQILRCQGLNALIRQANGGREIADFRIETLEVWHEWEFLPEGVKSPQPKWVTSTNTQPYLPRHRTPVPNLFIAGAHTRTQADVWSIEAAVESGRRAAKAIDPNVVVLEQDMPAWLRVIGYMDDVCFRAGLPHVLDVALWTLVAGAGAVALFFAW